MSSVYECHQSRQGESGHWPWIDDPDGAANRIVPFLKRQLVAAT
jgi:hypothetical protein